MDFDYEHYEENDYTDLVEMVFALYHEDPEGKPINEGKIIRTIYESLSHPEKVQIIMIRAEGVNVGYGLITFMWSNEFGGDVINIDELYVRKEYRNRRAATNFVWFIVGVYSEAVLFELEVTPSNSDALKFYQTLGFEFSSNMRLKYSVQPSGDEQGEA